MRTFKHIRERLRRSYTYRKKIDIHNNFAHTFLPDVTGQEASDAIYGVLAREGGAMVARFGGVELDILTNYLDINDNFISQNIKYIKGELTHFRWDDKIFDYNYYIYNKRDGNRRKNIERYCRLYLEDIPQVDVLGSWLESEKKLSKYFAKSLIKVPLYDLEPYFHKNPWSRILAGKKVLVMHSFEDSIIRQYSNRAQLFKDPNVLPDFSLKVINTFITFFNEKQDRYESWFQMLDDLKRQMDEADYDIAIIGCGPAGFHLAAHAKRRGKKGIHLGGAVQTLFGITGKKWEVASAYKGFKENYINPHWVRPSPAETPSRGIPETLDGASYW